MDAARVEALLCERYNVREVPAVFAEALAAGDAAELSRLVGEREMYRWGPALRLALADVAEAEPEATEEEPSEATESTDEAPDAEAEPEATEEEEPKAKRTRK